MQKRRTDPTRATVRQQKGGPVCYEMAGVVTCRRHGSSPPLRVGNHQSKDLIGKPGLIPHPPPAGPTEGSGGGVWGGGSTWAKSLPSDLEWPTTPPQSTARDGIAPA